MPPKRRSANSPQRSDRHPEGNLHRPRRKIHIRIDRPWNRRSAYLFHSASIIPSDSIWSGLDHRNYALWLRLTMHLSCRMRGFGGFQWDLQEILKIRDRRACYFWNRKCLWDRHHHSFVYSLKSIGRTAIILLEYRKWWSASIRLLGNSIHHPAGNLPINKKEIDSFLMLLGGKRLHLRQRNLTQMFDTIGPKLYK